MFLENPWVLDKPNTSQFTEERWFDIQSPLLFAKLSTDFQAWHIRLFRDSNL